MRLLAVAVVIATAIGAAACGSDGKDLAPVPATTTTAGGSATAPVDVIARLELPQEGVVVQDAIGGGLRFIDLAGAVVVTRPDWAIDSRWNPPDRPRIVTAEGRTLTIDALAGAVVDDRAQFVPEDGTDRAALARPAAIGHWRWEVVRPDGSILGQWSGECEVPVAYRFVSRDAAPVEVGQSAFALGWSSDGRAVVHFTEGTCGEQGADVGLFLVADDGTMSPVVVGPVAAARFWSAD